MQVSGSQVLMPCGREIKDNRLSKRLLVSRNTKLVLRRDAELQAELTSDAVNWLRRCFATNLHLSTILNADMDGSTKSFANLQLRKI